MDTHQHTSDGEHVRVWGDRGGLEIECPAEGVLRLRHAPVSATSSFLHPELPAKSSWAVLSPARLALESKEQDGQLRITAKGGALELSLGRTEWRFFGGDDRLLAHADAVEGDAIPAYPEPRYRSTLQLQAPSGEAYLGFGEKVGPLDKRGMKFWFWNTDVVPHQPDTDPLYVSIPFFIGVRDGVAWGLFLDETWRSEVDVALADPKRVRWTSTGPELDTYLIAGPHPATVLQRFVQLTGRAPMPPLWSLGAQQSRWGYENEETIRSVIAGYRKHRLPLDCVYLDIDHMEGYRSLTWDRSRFRQPAELAADALKDGVRLVPIVDPGIAAVADNPHFVEAKAKDLLVRTDRGETLIGEVWARPAAFPDFTQATVRAWWSEAHRPFLEAGVGGFWNDMNEPSNFSLPPEAPLLPAAMAVQDTLRHEGKTLPDFARHGPRRHLEMHNVYGQAMSMATFEAAQRFRPDRRPFVLTRAGYAGIHRYAAVWTGDNSSHWSHLELSVPMLLGLGLGGVAFSGVDVPGFLGNASSELFVRWMQSAIFYPLLRNHSAKGTPFQEPWRFGEPALTLARELLERRYRLLPTLYTLMHEASQTGLPPLRPLLFQDPGDAETLGAYEQFLFGRDLMVAPVVRPTKTRILSYLPQGRWLRFSNLEPGEVLEGRTHVVSEAPLPVTPMYLRAGGGIALTQPAQHTTDANWESLEWHLHLAPEFDATLYEDAGDGAGDSRLTRIEGTFDGKRVQLANRRVGHLPLRRDHERLLLYGIPPVAKVAGAELVRSDPQLTELRAPSEWTELTLDVR